MNLASKTHLGESWKQSLNSFDFSGFGAVFDLSGAAKGEGWRCERGVQGMAFGSAGVKCRSIFCVVVGFNFGPFCA